MMKKQIIITITSFFMLATQVHAADKYVTDDVNIYLRRGPGTQYAFSGAVKAGDKVTELEVSADGKFARIQDADGRIAWIETKQLNDSPSLKEKVPALETELAKYKDQVDNGSQNQKNMVNGYVDKLNIAEQTIETLQKQNEQLQKQVNEQNKQIDSMTTQVDEKRQDLILTWFTYGGLVAGGGLLIGLILPSIMPNRRRRDRWMR